MLRACKEANPPASISFSRAGLSTANRPRAGCRAGSRRGNCGGREAKPAGSTFSSVEQDVISALVNMQCKQAAAEEAIRKAKAAGVPDEFEALFRQAFQFVR